MILCCALNERSKIYITRIYNNADEFRRWLIKTVTIAECLDGIDIGAATAAVTR
jgi:hypothetical protein